MHDWPEEQALQILKHLRAAASPTTQLLVIDPMAPYACRVDVTSTVSGTIPGAFLPPPPAPVLANLGEANTSVYYADMHMLTMFGAQERTIDEFVSLTGKAGWKIVKVHRPTGSELIQLECKCA